MSSIIQISPKIEPPLDPGFVPASLWCWAYQMKVTESRQGKPLAIALARTDGSVSVFRTTVFPHEGTFVAANEVYVERLVKFLLWQRGGFKVFIGGPPAIGDGIRQAYAPNGARRFDYHFMGQQVYEQPFEVVGEPYDYGLPGSNYVKFGPDGKGPGHEPAKEEVKA